MGLNDEVYRLRREAMTDKQLKRAEREENRKRREELRKDTEYIQQAKDIVETDLFNFMMNYYEKNGYFASNYYFKIYSTRQDVINLLFDNECQQRYAIQNYDKIFKKVDNIFKNSIILPVEESPPAETKRAKAWATVKEIAKMIFNFLEVIFKILGVVGILLIGYCNFLCSLTGGSRKRYR